MKEILKMVKVLSPTEQKKLYADIGALIALYSDSPIVELCELHQDMFKESIKFSKTVVDSSDKTQVISVVLSTKWGQYIGVGKNKKGARENAAQQALDNKPKK